MRELPIPRQPALIAKTSLLSAGELRFFKALKKSIARKYHIAIKVRVADLIDCSGAAWDDHGKKLSGMHVDFVLVRPKDTCIVACIELDDRSHAAEATARRDAIKHNALASANIPLIRFPARSAYKKKEIKSTIRKELREFYKRLR